MKKALLLSFFILIVFCTGDQKEIILLSPNKPYTLLINNGQKRAFRIEPNENTNNFQVNIYQCGIDIEAEYYKGDKVIFVDRPTGNYANESFFIKKTNSTPIDFHVYSIDSDNHSGYIEIYIKNENTLNFDKLQSAEINYLSGYRLQNYPSKENLIASIRKYKNSVSDYKELDQKALEAEVSTQLARSYHLLENYTLSIEWKLKAINLFSEINDPIKMAFLFHEIAASYHEMHDLNAALYYYQKACNLFTQLKREDQLSYVYGNISYLYLQNGKALLEKYYLDLSLKDKYIKGNSYLKFTGFHKLGLYYYTQGMFDESLYYQKKAQKIAQDHKHNHSDVYINTLLRISDTYKEMEDWELAEQFAKESAEKSHALGINRLYGQSLLALGEISYRRGHFREGISLINQSLKFHEENWKDKAFFGLGLIWYHINLYENSQVNFDKSVYYFEKAIDSKPDPWVLGQALYWWTMIHYKNNIEVNFDKLISSINITENRRRQLINNKERYQYFGNQHHPYRLFVEILFNHTDFLKNSDFANSIFNTFEKIRARTLLDTSNQTKPRKKHLPSLEEVQEYYRLLYEMEEQFHDNNAIATMEKQLVPLAIKMERLDPTSHAVDPEAIQDADTIVKAIDDPQTMLISYVFGLDKTYLMALDQTGLQVHNLGKAHELHKLVEKVHPYLKMNPLRRQGLGKQAYEETVSELGKALLGPLGDLKQKKRLIFIPDRSLQLLPFGILPIQAGEKAGEPLMDRFQTAVLPSASVWKALKDRADSRPQASKSMAIMANPVFNQADTRLRGTSAAKDDRHFLASLPQTQKEAQGIAQFAGKDAFIATGFEANRQLAKSGQLEDYRYLHFATHAEIDAENPGQSSLVLSRFDAMGQPLNGTVQLNDISQMKLNADLVTLSACETAQGKMIRGEGLMSLARGFMAAGVPRVVGTLWKVPDDATSHFMIAFYKAHLKHGMSPAESLRQAQITVRSQSRWEDPHYWAGFILIGDWE